MLSAPEMPTRRQSFSVVFAIELWERFGYYGMQAVLTLYLVQRLKLSDTDANVMIGAFVGLTYIMPVLGGLIGDRLLGPRRTMLIGAFILALGYVALGLASSHRALLFGAMALISSGNGLFKPNSGNLVRRIYEGDDAELDAAFTIYYMAVNVGSTISMLLTPWLQERFGPSTAFFTCAFGLVAGLLYYMWRRQWIVGAGSALDRGPWNRRTLLILSLGFVIVAGGSMVVIASPMLARLCVWGACFGIAIAWARIYRRALPEQKPGLRLTFLLCLESMAYIIFYQQQMTSLTLFALRDVDGDFRIGDWVIFHMSAGQFQALNPLWIMLGSPILAVLYKKLAQSGRDLSLAQKMVLGFGLVTGGFLIWWLAAAYTAGPVSAWVMFVGYGLISIAELLTMALGLAIIARYAPADSTGFMMGALYLLWGVAMYVGSLVANYAAVTGDAKIVSIGSTVYAPLFRDLFFAGLGLTCLLALLLPLAQRWDRVHMATQNQSIS
ncbi:peptide transporter [Kozakia baliensis]|uniref:Peptide transporter n=2 Tax=Kozakia baliensis TaxID=153496 RepID=A0A1D8UXB4_9PROT|nr:peptide transporter [Kozakia baliensis]AOX21311.1 peptide transporter [Kozakia baliensis]